MARRILGIVRIVLSYGVAATAAWWCLGKMMWDGSDLAQFGVPVAMAIATALGGPLIEKLLVPLLHDPVR